MCPRSRRTNIITTESTPVIISQIKFSAVFYIQFQYFIFTPYSQQVTIQPITTSISISITQSLYCCRGTSSCHAFISRITSSIIFRLICIVRPSHRIINIAIIFLYRLFRHLHSPQNS